MIYSLLQSSAELPLRSTSTCSTIERQPTDGNSLSPPLLSWRDVWRLSFSLSLFCGSHVSRVRAPLEREKNGLWTVGRNSRAKNIDRWASGALGATKALCVSHCSRCGGIASISAALIQCISVIRLASNGNNNEWLMQQAALREFI